MHSFFVCFVSKETKKCELKLTQNKSNFNFIPLLFIFLKACHARQQVRTTTTKLFQDTEGTKHSTIDIPEATQN